MSNFQLDWLELGLIRAGYGQNGEKMRFSRAECSIA